MKYFIRTIMTTGYLFCNAYTFAENQTMPSGREKQRETSTPKVSIDGKLSGGENPEDSVAYVTPLVYHLPKRGAPDTSRLVGAGTRANGEHYPYLAVLTPKHTGLTLEKQPALYWFTSELIARPLEFVLISDQSVAPVLKIPLPAPQRTGIQQVLLSDYDVRLEAEIEYKWSVALISNPEMRSHDIVTSGKIKRITPTQTLKRKLTNAPAPVHPSIYAKEGIWYDLIANLANLIEKRPTDRSLQENRAQLLDQVGLAEVAKHERNRRVVDER